MNRIRVGTIVEGHGEVAAIPVLIRRVWQELLNGEFVDVLTPYRINRPRFVRNQDNTLTATIEFVARQLHAAQSPVDGSFALVVVDGDESPPCVLGPAVLDMATAARSDLDIACVVATREYESWFVAAAESLGRYLRLPADDQMPPASAREIQGKGWIQRHWLGRKYSETVDQPRLTAAMDLTLCRAISVV